MSEQLLKALMQLFAIVANTEGITTNRRKVVERLLNQQLSPTLSQQYLDLFDSFVNELNEKRKGKMVSVNNSVKVIKICTQINKELTQGQKTIVLIRLLELITAENQPTPDDLEFTDTVATAFNFDAEEYNTLKAFILQSPETLVSRSLLVVSQQKPVSLEIKHVYRENLTQPIYVLRIASVGIYIVRHFLHDDLFLNGQLISPSMTHILSSGAIIRSSRFQAIYQSDVSAAFLHDKLTEKVVYTANEITYTFSNGHQGLYPLSFSEATGQMIGIMGASGAGKSTLLNVLNGNDAPTTGEITVNGINIHAKNVPVKQLIGYVSQDDLLMEDLTVYENLYYSALLSFGSLAPEEVSEKVLDMLEAIGLKDRKDLKVGSPLNKKISGGQRKRLNIALELIREPYILFVDEPTSGLSSRDSENIMDLLKELAQKGKLVFVVIHQPSSDIFKLFDKLLILDTGGFPIYYGNTLDSITYFKQQSNQASSESECATCGNVNPESIFSIIETKIVDEFGNLTPSRKLTPAQWKERFDQVRKPLQLKAEEKTNKIPSVGGNKPGLLKQFRIFFTRDLLNKLANRQYMLINMLEAPLLAVVLALILKMFHGGRYVFNLNENMPSYLFMSVVVALFVGLTVSAEEIFKDRKILKREKFLDLSRLSYLNSKIAVLFILSAIQMALFAVIGNCVLEIHGMTTAYWLVLFSSCCFANMLGLNISSAFNSAVTIYILIPILLIPQLLLSGVIVKFDKLFPPLVKEKSVPIIGNMMTSRWAFEALATYQFTQNSYEAEFGVFHKRMAVANYKKDYWLPKLREKLEECKSGNGNITADLELIRYELQKENATGVQLKQLASYDFTKPGKTLYDQLDDLFSRLNDYYIEYYNKAYKAQDQLTAGKYGTPETQAQLVKKIEDNNNESLANLMLNNLSAEKVVESEGELVAKSGTPYLNSYNGNYPMYTTQKTIFGGQMDTLWYNVIVIWLMTIVLYISLYLNIPAKVTRLE